MKLNEVFGHEGLLASNTPGYEDRVGQVTMATMVESAIQNGFSAIIEGSTGVGKSFAYLIPIILSGKNAIISTSNKSLQDQLSNKDLPLLKKILPLEFTWTVLKGKNNYFCHEHFKANRKEITQYYLNQGLSETDAKLKLKDIEAWADETLEGDVEYYPNDLPQVVKEMIVCDSKSSHEKGSVFADMCFANKARKRAKESRILLINHTLLALDISIRRDTDNKAKILPDSQVVVIDEAHTFERYAVMAFSDEISWFSLHHLINWQIVRKALSRTEINQLSNTFRDAIDKYLPERGKTGYYNQTKFPKFEGFDLTIRYLEKLIEKIKNNSKSNIDDVTQTKIREIIKEAETLIKRLNDLTSEDENMLRWSEARETDRGIVVKLKSVPIDVSNLLKDGLFPNRTVVCTSATLTVNKSFDFFRYQLGVPETAMELIVDSPFNFKENCLIYISTGQYEKYWEVQELLKLSQGRAFVLFTSYKDMREMYDMVTIPYPKFIQNSDITRVQTLEDFRNTPNAVLFATKSFWEGVDIKGDQLSIVIIHKIPFENPSDLVYSSKIEQIDKRLGKGKSWSRFTIPDACLKLKQGAGRLIRSQEDKGVIALLDARINYQNYGKIILDSLPPAYRTQKLEKVKSFFEKWNQQEKKIS